jgi:predicted signal transduction protein with EAL and GGDEF domain
VSRFGGDEFTMLLRDLAGPESAGDLVARILRDLPRAASEVGVGIAPTASAGIAVFPGDGDDAQALMKNADVAMYHAKQHGRNRHEFFSASMNAASARRVRVEAALRRSLVRGELELHYQPRIELATGRVVAFEGLMRWTDAELGRVSPSEALTVAEASGLIEDVGEWSLQEACVQIQTWERRGFVALPIAVNVHPRQVAGGRLRDGILRLLQRTGVRPEQIQVEITEHAVIQDDEAVAISLRDLRAVGIRVALDDFGTGYSSLAYLTRLPLDLLKLDRTFVRDVADDPSVRGVVSATIAMARSLGLRVVAEGVDAAEQANVLRELGCEELQGFLVSPAIPGEAAERFLRLRADGD